MGSAFMEELDLHIAMTLQQLGRTEEATELMMAFVKMSRSQRRKVQAQFIMDVINSPSDFRNEEGHKIFEQTWRVTEDLAAAGSGSFSLGTGRAPTVFLSPRERAQRAWISE